MSDNLNNNTNLIKRWFKLFVEGSKAIGSAQDKLNAAHPELSFKDQLNTNKQAKWNLERAKIKDELRKKGEYPPFKAIAVFAATSIFAFVAVFVIFLAVIINYSESERKAKCENYTFENLDSARDDNCGDIIISKLESGLAAHEKEQKEKEQKAEEEKRLKEESEKKSKSECSSKGHDWNDTYGRCNSEAEQTKLNEERAKAHQQQSDNSPASFSGTKTLYLSQDRNTVGNLKELDLCLDRLEKLSSTAYPLDDGDGYDISASLTYSNYIVTSAVIKFYYQLNSGKVYPATCKVNGEVAKIQELE